jgi:hypothetical protein
MAIDDGTLSLDQVLGNPTSPSGATTPVPHPEMLAYANQSLAEGMSPDDAMQAAFEQYPESEGVAFTLAKDGNSFVDKGAPSDGLTLDQVISQAPEDTGNGLSVSQVTEHTPGEEVHNPETPHTNVQSTLQKTLKWANEFGLNRREDVRQFLGNVRSYFHDYEAKHELVDGGEITPQQKAAAKLLGMNLPDFPIWGPVYKISPEDRAKADEKFQESMGLKPQETKERLAKTTSPDPAHMGEFDPFGNFLNDSLITHLASQAFSPELATSKKYYAVKDMMENMDAVEHPEKYSPEFVKYSADKILAYKKMNETGTVQQIKDFAGEFKKNPIGGIKGLAGGVLSDPELLVAPEARLGSLLAGPREAAALTAAGKAAQLSKLAGAVRGAAAKVPEIEKAAGAAADVYGRVAERATGVAKQMAAARHVGDVVSTAATGAGINAAVEGASQVENEGYVRKGGLTLAEVTGAAFGAGGHALGTAAGKILPKGKAPAARTEEPTPVEQPTPTEPTAETPTNTTPPKVDTGDNLPEQVPMTNRNGKKVDVPVLQTVGYRNAIEAPLLDLKKPMTDAGIAALRDRIGPDNRIPTELVNKLRKGESLTPEEARSISTMAEDHMVETLYNVDPADYHAQVSGKQSGSIDPRLLATGAVVGGGALAGTMAPGDKEKNALLGSIAGLATSALFWGGDVGVRGPRAREGGMFVGPKSRNWNPTRVEMAEHMEKMDRTPDEITLATGLHRNAAKQWTGEISDKDMKLAPPDNPNWKRAEKEPVPLSTVVNHDKLDAAYPGLLYSIKLRINPKMKVLGSFDPTTRTLMLRKPPEVDTPSWTRVGPSRRHMADSVIAHEVQHMIQELEGFPRGSNATAEAQRLLQVKKYLEDRQETVYQKLLTAEREGRNTDNLEKQYEQIQDQLIGNYTRAGVEYAAQGNYFASAGETQARNVQSRLGLGPTERRVKTPRQTQDVTTEHQIVRFHEKGGSNMEEARRPYKEVPDTLMGFKKTGPNKGFEDTKYKHTEYVKVTFPNGRTIYDAIKGMSSEHALERARRNWPNTEIGRSDKDTFDWFNRYEEIQRKQKGSIDPEMLGRLARSALLGTVGATIGLRLSSDDDKWRGALAGAGLAIMSGPLLTQFLVHPVASARRLAANLRQAAQPIAKENITEATSRWQAAGLIQEVNVARMQAAIKKIAPTKASRIRITHALDAGSTAGLTPSEIRAYQIARQFDDALGRMGQSAGVLNQLINNHISHIWRNDAKLKAYKQLINSQVIANMSPKTAFATARQLKSIAQGKAAGLTPVTEDVSEILSIYAKSVMNAIRNKQLLAALKSTKDSSGQVFLVTSTRKAPFNYVPINHPQLRGLSVHPTIAPELRNVFYTYDSGAVQGALSTLNMALKRSAVSFSAFHLTSLADAFLGGMPTFTHPIRTISEFARGVIGSGKYQKALYGKADPGTQALFGRFLESGAVPQIAKGVGRDIDLSGNNYYEGLKQMQEYMDKAMPGLGKLPDFAAKASHVMDHVIFENGMSAGKFALWIHAVQKINDAWAKEARLNPNVKVPRQIDIDRMAGNYVNNLMGAQNWLLGAEQATTRLGRTYLRALGSPVGRKIASYLLFAPDWTTSTVMSLTKAFSKGSEQFGEGFLGKLGKGMQGLHNPKTVADLHRIYQFRSAMLYALIGGIINYAYTGHYIWDNKDPTTIDLGNGQRLQWNKHWTEPYDIMHGAAQGNLQPVYNKLGVFPHEVAEQFANKEYINIKPGGFSPPMKHSRLTHALGKFVPIPFQNMEATTPGSLMWKLVGRNVLGFPTEDKEWAARAKAARSAKRKAAAEKKKQERLKKLYGG